MDKISGRVPLHVLVVSIVLGGALYGCGKQDFLYYRNPSQDTAVSFDAPIKELVAGGNLDIIWIIDNSGSMGDHQKNVTKNVSIFMQEFITRNLQWKMGLISTDTSDSPLIGFADGDELLSDDPKVLTRFQSAVSRLGTNGSADEKSFLPLRNVLREYPKFLRPGVPLMVISITDAPEQSQLKVVDFVDDFRRMIGTTKKYYFYGVWQTADLGCPLSSDDTWLLKGSDYELFQKSAAGGKAYPLCNPDFGSLMSNLAEDISHQVSKPSVYLQHRPKIKSLRVSFHGRDLPGGPPEEGGLWTYDFGRNAVMFSDLGFAAGDTASIHVIYDQDNGLD